MQRYNGKYIYSPSDLVNYLGCRHASYLEKQRVDERAVAPEADAVSRLLQKKGIEHERAYLQELKAQHGRVAEIPTRGDLERRAHLTREAVRSGADVIYQAVLLDMPKDAQQASWRGDADFLIKHPRSSSLGDYSYEVLDTKLARRASTEHVMQLCVYSELLAALQGIRPKEMHLYLGSGEICSFRTAEFFYYYARTKSSFEQYASRPPDSSYPSPCRHCTFCSWHTQCQLRWENDNHLSLVADIRGNQVAALQRAGIDSVAGLAAAAPRARPTGLSREQFNRLQAQAALQTRKANTGVDEYQLLSCPESQGFARMPRPDEGDLFFDMEGDPLHPDGLEYLFGIHHVQNGQNSFVPFWAHSHEEEKRAFIEFMDFVGSQLQRYPDAYIYHYNHYETTALKRLACRYAVCEEALDNLLRQQKFVDLYKVVRENIRTSELGYSIKNLETFYMDQRADAVTSAADSIVIYNEWRESADDQLLADISDYNRVDCESTRLLRDWLLKIRPRNVPWFTAARDKNGDEGDEHDTQSTRKDREVEYEKYRKRLGVNRDDPSPIHERLAHLLEFHNREAKTSWWEMFERQGKPEEELVDDAECLAGLRLDGKPCPEKRSLVYSYRFPPQECRLKEGVLARDVELAKFAGLITRLDEGQRIVKLKRGVARDPLPDSLSIGPPGPIDTRIIRAAIYRAADRVVREKKGKTPVVYELLGRHLPRLYGRPQGKPVISTGAAAGDTGEQALEAIAALDRSYLFIQGPPGSGKTYTSSHIIAALIQRKKKIGVASNSHQAVHNLLRAIEAVAASVNMSFRGIKKSTSNAETRFEGKFIDNEARTQDMDLDANLFAGTTWTFAHKHFDDKLDYLFIDEAGQLSTANVVAMSSAAANIVLVGDQMQLGQPTQGTHPGEAGLSVLEFLLGQDATIPVERGIFLGETYRMRESICRFVSDAFYEGRLSANKRTASRSLRLKKNKLPNEGIVLVPVQHDERSQMSEEEGQVIERLYRELLGASLVDGGGKTVPVSQSDILVVAPYNLQVDHLASLLARDARVGTVDKFQGQEAPIVLISMTSSSAEHMPRNMEFLYSRRRLNVALSRAQCLAVVVMSPKLMEAPCHTPDQLRLVNTFCQLGEYATLVPASEIC